MANNAVTVPVELRNTEPHVKPVWKRTTTFTIETGGGHAEISETIAVNGILKEVVIEVGAAAGISGTVDVDLDDSDGVEFSTNATLAEGSETILSFDKPVTDFIIRADASDDPTSGDWTITVTTRGI